MQNIRILHFDHFEYNFEDTLFCYSSDWGIRTVPNCTLEQLRGKLCEKLCVAFTRIISFHLYFSEAFPQCPISSIYEETYQKCTKSELPGGLPEKSRAWRGQEKKSNIQAN